MSTKRLYLLSNKRLTQTFGFEARGDEQAKRRARVVISERKLVQKRFKLTTLTKNGIREIPLI